AVLAERPRPNRTGYRRVGQNRAGQEWPRYWSLGPRSRGRRSGPALGAGDFAKTQDRGAAQLDRALPDARRSEQASRGMLLYADPVLAAHSPPRALPRALRLTGAQRVARTSSGRSRAAEEPLCPSSD